ncbi:MAG: hypothetical protein ABMA00_13590, partial [Gemmatimonas sp.]
MHALPTDWGALCALVFLLGMRHGLDADHLAAIDGLTRLSSRQERGYARYCGALFSLGHGIVVLSIAALAGTLGSHWVPPSWFESLGSIISIGFLAVIGIVNLRAVLSADSLAVVPLVGLRGKALNRLLARLGRTQGAAAVMGAGSLFALSFDTLSQSALFAVMAVQFGGIEHALTLGLLFVLGMLASDGANGWWISHLIGRTDRLAVVASRVMGRVMLRRWIALLGQTGLMAAGVLVVVLLASWFLFDALISWLPMVLVALWMTGTLIAAYITRPTPF